MLERNNLQSLMVSSPSRSSACSVSASDWLMRLLPNRKDSCIGVPWAEDETTGVGCVVL